MSSQASQQAPARLQTPYRKMYYIRVACAIGGGIIAGALQFTDVGGVGMGLYGLILGLGIFIMTYIIFTSVKSIANAVLDKNKFLLTGIFSFFLIYFIVWTITVNLMYPFVP